MARTTVRHLTTSHVYSFLYSPHFDAICASARVYRQNGIYGISWWLTAGVTYPLLNFILVLTFVHGFLLYICMFLEFLISLSFLLLLLLIGTNITVLIVYISFLGSQLLTINKCSNWWVHPREVHLEIWYWIPFKS